MWHYDTCDTCFQTLYDIIFFFKIKNFFFNKSLEFTNTSVTVSHPKHGKTAFEASQNPLIYNVFHYVSDSYEQSTTTSRPIWSPIGRCDTCRRHKHPSACPGQREGWFAIRKRPRLTPSPGFWPHRTTFHGIVQNDIQNRIVRYLKSYSTISQIV